MNRNSHQSGLMLLSLCSGLIAVQAQTTTKTPGASVPFITIEAESPQNRIQGKTVRMTGLPSKDDSSPEIEASGRAFTALAKTGDYLEVPIVPSANTIVIRHSIPDAPNGGGQTATLSLYVNGVFRQKLELSSKHNWLYGKKGGNGQTQNPSDGHPHVFWDESRYFIKGELKQGDTLRLQKDNTDIAQFYHLDLIELEQAPPPLNPPPAGTYLSVTDFGANGNDKEDDSLAIQKCIDAAKGANKIVWMPAGTYYQTSRFTLDGVVLQGAGMWHTQLIGTKEGERGGATFGFTLSGNGATIRDLYMNCDFQVQRSRVGGRPFNGSPTNWRIENVWITHSQTGMWIKGKNGVVRGCRIRFTYADGINLNNGSTDNLVEHNHIRGLGDDGIALLSELEFKNPPSSNNTVRFNTVSSIWWGHNFDLAGGGGNLIEDNIFVDNAKMGCLTINLPTPFPMHPVTDAIFQRNLIIRGGGNSDNQRRGAVWMFPGSTTVSKVIFRDNQIIDPIFRGIHLAGRNAQEIHFERNVIDNPGQNAIFVQADVTGQVTLTDNIIRNHPAGMETVVNNAGAEFTLQQGKAPLVTVPTSTTRSNQGNLPPADIAAPKLDKDGVIVPRFLKIHENLRQSSKKGQVELLFLGDSITAAWHLGRDIWKEHYAPLKAANYGSAGDKTQNVLWRIENGELDGIRPKVIVLQIGTNNIAYPSGDISRGIKKIVKEINRKLPESKILLLGIFPRGADPSTSNFTKMVRTKISEVNAELAKLDNGKGLRFLDLGTQFLDAQGRLSTEIMPDGLHPNTAGYQIWAIGMQPLLEEMMR
jgi:lysophospholipase L1-like esterase